MYCVCYHCVFCAQHGRFVAVPVAVVLLPATCVCPPPPIEMSPCLVAPTQLSSKALDSGTSNLTLAVVGAGLALPFLDLASPMPAQQGWPTKYAALHRALAARSSHVVCPRVSAQVWIGTSPCELIQLHSTTNQIVCKTTESADLSHDMSYEIRVVVDGNKQALCTAVPQSSCSFRYRSSTSCGCTIALLGSSNDWVPAQAARLSWRVCRPAPCPNPAQS